MGCGASKDSRPAGTTKAPDEYGKAVARRRLSLAVQESTPNLLADSAPANYFGNSSVRTLGQRKGKVVFNAYSNTGYDPLDETYTRHNQDSYMVVENFGGKPDHYYFGVFDGHGEFGHYVSQTLAEELPKWLATRRIFGPVDPTGPAQECFEEFDKKIDRLVKSRFIASSVVASGATCNNAFLRGNELFVLNVGDSRAVLGRREDNGSYSTIDMSEDHKPDVPVEKKRIEAAGGLVCTDEDDDELGILRVWLPTRHSGMMVPGLAMSRSFGDYIVKGVGVIPRPDVKKRVLDDHDEFMVMASDGIWDVMSSKDVVEFVSKVSGLPSLSFLCFSESWWVAVREKDWCLAKAVKNTSRSGFFDFGGVFHVGSCSW
mmetsp:Transcript_18930/g.48188  ORF Transcript_18930/g.48188 Transcript_18930/m.48188 type:complete len:373 (-) Transcript_18930:3159-4277(-)